LISTSEAIRLGRDYHVFRSHGRRLMFSVAKASVFEIKNESLFRVLSNWEQEPEAGQSVEDLIEKAADDEAQRQSLNEALAELRPWTVCPDPAFTPFVIRSQADIHIWRLTLMVSGACNLRCRYCYTGLQTEKWDTGLMSADVARQAVDLILRHSPVKGLCINFFGGEPLLNLPVIQSTVAYVEQAAARLKLPSLFSMTTNGVLLDEGTIRYLHSKRFHLMISMDGPAEIHDRNRVFADGRGSHAIVEKNARLVREITGRLSLRATVTPSTTSVRPIQRYIEEIGGEGGFCFVMPTEDNNEGGRFVESAELRETRWKELMQIRAHCYDAWINGRAKPGPADALHLAFQMLDCRNSSLRPGCGMCFNSAAVGADGSLYPCHRFWPMPAYRIGNVQTGYDLEPLTRLLNTLHGTLAAHCQHCWARRICGEPSCLRKCCDGQGRAVVPSASTCAESLRSWEDLMGWYVRMQQEHPAVFEHMRNLPVQNADGVTRQILWRQ